MGGANLKGVDDALLLDVRVLELGELLLLLPLPLLEVCRLRLLLLEHGDFALAQLSQLLGERVALLRLAL